MRQYNESLIHTILSIFVICGCLCPSQKITKIYLKDSVIYVEMAMSAEQRQKGLMFRDRLADNKGMFFVFEQEGLYNFWMKNMKFALDIIWIDQDKRIVDVETNILPCKHEPCEILVAKAKARYVLEVNSGFAEKHRVKLGDRVSFLRRERVLGNELP